MHNSNMSAQRTTLGPAVDPMQRFFAAHQQEISVGHQAIAAAISETKTLMDRLGIASMYGCGIDCGPEPEYSGDIDKTERDMSALVSSARELRGLCETLAQRL